MSKKSKNNNYKKNKPVSLFNNNEPSTAKDPCGKCASPCACAACPKRILVVGGIERMEPLYRKLVEDCGLEFEYHAGHLRKGGNKLENCLQRADMILCPVNCNSHSACLQVKHLCKKHKKNLQLMRNFSLSAIERTLGEYRTA